MTILAATTLIVGSNRGEAHGQVYLIDLDVPRGARVLSWTRPGIDWDGVTGARGLRGIACAEDEVLIAAPGELLAFAPDFALRAVCPCAHLGDAQQLAIFRRTLYVVSTSYDAILAFDLDARRFEWGLHLVHESGGWRGVPFQPGSTLGPGPGRVLELNSIHCDARGLFIAGARTHGLLHFDGKRIKRLVTLPEGARDARPWRDGVLFTDTEAGCARFMTPRHNHAFRVPQRSGVPAGLCTLDECRFVSAAGPATLAVHDVDAGQTRLSITLDDDVRQAIHSIALWPFGAEMGSE